MKRRNGLAMERVKGASGVSECPERSRRPIGRADGVKRSLRSPGRLRDPSWGLGISGALGQAWVGP